MANLIINPDFEVNALNWQGGFGYSTMSRITTDHHSGTACGKITWSNYASPGQANITSVQTVVGNAYTATMWVKVPTGSPPVVATAWFVQNGTSSTVLDTWQQLTVSFVATTASTWVGIGCLSVANNTQYALLDDVDCELTTIGFALADPIGASITTTMAIDVLQPPITTEPIVPLRAVRMQLNDYRVFKGEATAVPDYDCRIVANIAFETGSDDVIIRPGQTDIQNAADFRWLAQDYDVNARLWAPFDGGPFIWRTNTTYYPSQNTDYGYFIGNDFISFSSVTFDKTRGGHFWSDLDMGVDSTTSYTMIMVASFRPPTGANYYGIWDAGFQPTGTGLITESVGDHAALAYYQTFFQTTYNTQDNRLSNSILNVTHTRPVMVALRADPKYVTLDLWAKGGVRSRSIINVQDDFTAYPITFLLGRPNGFVDPSASADMDVLDLAFYTSSLEDGTLSEEMAGLDSVYGVTA